MSVQRFVDTGFWEDQWVETLAPLEKYLYLYLITNPLTNIAGVYKITLKRIAYDTGLQPEAITEILARFEAAKKAYLHGEYIVLPAWPKHQRLDGRSKLKVGVDKVLDGLDMEMLKFLGVVGYRYDTPKIPIPHGYPMDTLSIPYGYPSSYSDPDTDSDTDTDPDPDAKGGPELSTSDKGRELVLAAFPNLREGLEDEPEF